MMKTEWSLVPWRGLRAVAELLTDGSDEDGKTEVWRSHPIEYHRRKFIRHAAEVAEGDLTALPNAVARGLMLLELLRDEDEDE